MRGRGDIERSVVITGCTRTQVNTYLVARTDPGTALFVSYSPGRPGRRLSVRGAEATCTRLGAANQITKLHPDRFRHTADTIVEDELGDPFLTADHFGHHGLGSVAGYAKISTHRRQEASLALGRRGRRAAEPGCRASASLKECIRRLADAEHPLILPRRRSME